MRAAVFTRYGAPSVVEVGKRPIPQPGKKEVRIRIVVAHNRVDTGHKVGNVIVTL